MRRHRPVPGTADFEKKILFVAKLESLHRIKIMLDITPFGAFLFMRTNR